MFAPQIIIPILKIAVGAVTALLLVSLIMLARGHKVWHGRINTVFFVLTMITVFGFEMIIRFGNPQFTSGFSESERSSLTIHLFFAIPSALILPFMLYSGKRHKNWHFKLALFFLVLWIGTFVTGIFFLPY